MKKVLSLCLVVIMAMTAIGGTLAYFTDTTEEVTNTFTMGDVKIKLDEAKITINKEAKTITASENERVEKGQAYNDLAMIPGRVFPKDPKVTNTGSLDAYIFLDMKLNKADALFWLMAVDASADTDAKFENVNIFSQEKKVLNENFKKDYTLEENSSIFSNFTIKNEYLEDEKFSTRKFIEGITKDMAAYQAVIEKWLIGINHNVWQLCDIIEDETEDEITFRFAYVTKYNELDMLGTDAEVTFMTDFTMPDTVSQTMLVSAVGDSDISVSGITGAVDENFTTDEEAFEITFKAYAIQADDITVEGSELVINNAYKAMFGYELDKDFFAQGTQTPAE